MPSFVPSPGSAAEVLWVFLRLGCVGFGGPAAHIAIFREELVVRRRWVDESTFADLLGLAQFLPGPGSSQMGFALGLRRAGWWGALAAWTGFTLPSAALLTSFALSARWVSGPMGTFALHGLRLAAVAIVAQAVLGMGRSFCTDAPRIAIALLAALASLFLPVASAQWLVIAGGAMMGVLLLRELPPPVPGVLTAGLGRGTAIACLVAFCALLALAIALPLLTPSPEAGFFAALYRAGALVFGGGHVLLPLLRDALVTPGWIADEAFLGGYGAAQAIPGPMFSFSAYLGAANSTALHGLAGSLLGLLAIFVPGMLVMVGALPFWDRVRTISGAQGAMHGIQASVVGLLTATLVSPVASGSIRGFADALIAVTGFVLLVRLRVPPVIMVGMTAMAAVASGWLLAA